MNALEILGVIFLIILIVLEMVCTFLYLVTRYFDGTDLKEAREFSPVGAVMFYLGAPPGFLLYPLLSRIADKIEKRMLAA